MGVPPFHTLYFGTFIRTLASGEVLFSLNDDIWLLPEHNVHVWVVPPVEEKPSEFSLMHIQQKDTKTYFAKTDRKLSQSEGFLYRKCKLISKKNDVDPSSPLLFGCKDLFDADGRQIGKTQAVRLAGKQWLVTVELPNNMLLDVPYVKELIVNENSKCLIMKVPKGLEPYKDPIRISELGAEADYEI